MTTCILIPLGNDKYKVSNVGKPYFWPHDGDIITQNDIAYIQQAKNWEIKILDKKE